jgi:SSS family solute:Na+ symporter
LPAPLIGMAASVALANIEIAAKDDVYAEVAQNLLPVGIGGLVLAGAVAAMMSTASGALIAAATAARADVLPFVASWFGKNISTEDSDNPEHDVKANRIWVLTLGIIAIVIAIITKDVVAALTIAYESWWAVSWSQSWAAWCGSAAPARAPWPPCSPGRWPSSSPWP